MTKEPGSIQDQLDELRADLDTMHEELLDGAELFKSWLESHQRVHTNHQREMRDALNKATDVRGGNTHSIYVQRAELTELIAQVARRVAALERAE